jgi:hypothetical protein
MWILPKNYQLSSAFAQDMVESKEDLTLLELKHRVLAYVEIEAFAIANLVNKMETDSVTSRTYLHGS